MWKKCQRNQNEILTNLADITFKRCKYTDIKKTNEKYVQVKCIDAFSTQLKWNGWVSGQEKVLDKQFEHLQHGGEEREFRHL